jgi:hypothetical protein
MPPGYEKLTNRAVELAPQLAKRSLTVNHTQAVTLGVMAVYVVVIALLWNLPYVRWSLWPFKVWTPSVFLVDGASNRVDVGYRLP